MLDLLLDLFENVHQTIEVLSRALDSVRSLASAVFVLGYAGRFLEEDTHLLRLGLDQPRDHPLLDNGITSRPQAGAKKHAGNVFATTLGAVQVISRYAIACYLTANRNFSIFGVLALERGL